MHTMDPNLVNRHNTLTSTRNSNSLSPETIKEIQVTIYALFLSAGILIWDILFHLKDDHRMLTKGPLKAPVVVYLVSRFSLLGLLITGFFVGPAGIDINCQFSATVMKCFLFLILSCNTGFFFLRARAIYTGNSLARTFLLALWLVTAASGTIPFFIIDAAQSPDKEISSCIAIEKDFSVGVIIVIAALVHDTAIFVAVSYQMYQFTCIHDHDKPGIFKFFNPNLSDLSPLWKCMFQDGQLYYLISVFWNIVVTVLAANPSLGPYYHFFLFPLFLCIMNSLACQVFRNVRLGKFREEELCYRNTTNLIVLAEQSIVFVPGTDISLQTRHSDIQSGHSDVVLHAP